MLIALDAGHGGSDPGAVYFDRQEKNDNLKLAMAVGELLQDAGVKVFYTREEDIYETPFKKAMDANNEGADYFVSFHRNSSENPNAASGAQVLIYNKGGKKEELAENILDNLVGAGFNNLGIVERPNLVVLKRTNMPAVLIETGFINNTTDNELYDDKFDIIAKGIAEGILRTAGYSGLTDTMEAPESRLYEERHLEDKLYRTDPYDGLYEGESSERKQCVCDKMYRVQVGAFRKKENADRLLAPLLDMNYPAFIIYQDGLYKVQVGAFRKLDNAVAMEKELRRCNYNTYITT